MSKGGIEPEIEIRVRAEEKAGELGFDVDEYDEAAIVEQVKINL